MLWFAEGKIKCTVYDGEEKTFMHRTIVKADNDDEASQKYHDYWEAKTDPYSVYFSVESLQLNEVIE